MKRGLLILLGAALALGSCKKSTDTTPGGAISPRSYYAVGVGGEAQPNHVFVDLSEGLQEAVIRDSWDIALSSGPDARVILNGAAQVMISRTDKYDLAAVVDSDYVDLQNRMHVDVILGNFFGPPPYPTWLEDSKDWIDEANGDLNATAWGDLTNMVSTSSVFIVHRGKDVDDNDRGWLKVQVWNNGSGYTIRYADLSGGPEMEKTVAKESDYNFVHFNFDHGIVPVTPVKTSWDIAFTTWMERLDAGGGLFIPYYRKDFVIQNPNGVETAIHVVSDPNLVLTEYDNFSLADVSLVTFSSDLNGIGSDWRTVASPTPGTVTAVKGDRFYIVKDPAGKYFKLIFTHLLNDMGERGYPQILFEELT
jgi:hypothetical protein